MPLLELTKERVLLNIFYLIVFSTKLNSQNINFEYNKSQVGKSLRVGYEQRLIPNFIVEGGLKYIIWTGVSDKEAYTFKDRFRPTNLIEHLGLYTNVKYRILYNDYCSLFVYYNGAVTNCHLITDGYIHTGGSVFDSTTGQYYDEVQYVFQVRPKTFAFENYIGFESSWKLSNKIEGYGRIGLGYTFYHIQYDPNFITLNPNKGEYSWFMGGLGIKYKFNDKSSQSK